MLPFFPTPYPNEILYSVFARYHSQSPNINGTQTVKDLFNKYRMECSVELPSHLNALIANMPPNNPYSAERLIKDNTLFLYYTAFASAKSAEAIKDYILGKKVDIYNRITNLFNPQSQNRYLRFCPKCNEKAFEQYGELYWNRLHQMRGIHICPVHKEPIYNSAVRLDEHKYMYIPATAENCIIEKDIVYSGEVHRKLSLIAEEVLYIIKNFNRMDIKEQYKNQLKILGYATVNGGLRQKAFVKDFEAFWGDEILNLTHNTITKTNNCNWLVETSWDRILTGEPIRHILLSRFLGISIEHLFNFEIQYKPFGEPPYPCLNPVCPECKKNVIKNVNIKNNYKEKSPIGYFACPLCRFAYLRRGPDKCESDRYRYSRIVEYGNYWRQKLDDLLKIYSVPKTAKLMGTTHTTIYDYIKKTTQLNE